eukprot:s4405_g1.t1
MAYRLPPPPPPGRAPDCPMDPEGMNTMQEMLSKVFQFEIMIHILKDCKRQLEYVRVDVHAWSIPSANCLEQSISFVDQSIRHIQWLKVFFLYVARDSMEEYYNTHLCFPDVEDQDETV